MRSVLVAALVVRVSAAGGAGAGVEEDARRQQVGNTWEDVRKHFSALRSEISTLENEFRDAQERHRLDAERKRLESERARRGQP
ncbi:hypothetical protein JQX13_35180 [Archangium violaceum]|uniref:hypothetical protein n=1 Tax=Archangium violaceum TaxID=83451 RepID=UPI00193BF1F2|nr:hypothetical protein [Archangium violaceum]QRK05393.1 hypothetical protein JQX13_35180 [Archangium violaceum]